MSVSSLATVVPFNVNATYSLFSEIDLVEIVAIHDPHEFWKIDMSVQDRRGRQIILRSLQRVLGQQSIFASDPDEDACSDKNKDDQDGSGRPFSLLYSDRVRVR